MAHKGEIAVAVGILGSIGGFAFTLEELVLVGGFLVTLGGFLLNLHSKLKRNKRDKANDETRKETKV